MEYLHPPGEKLLKGNGTVSHLQAMKKAEDEYKKYKARTISDVENDYLNSIEMIESKCKKNDRYVTRSKSVKMHQKRSPFCGLLCIYAW